MECWFCSAHSVGLALLLMHIRSSYLLFAFGRPCDHCSLSSRCTWLLLLGCVLWLCVRACRFVCLFILLVLLRDITFAYGFVTTHHTQCGMKCECIDIGFTAVGLMWERYYKLVQVQHGRFRRVLRWQLQVLRCETLKQLKVIAHHESWNMWSTIVLGDVDATWDACVTHVWCHVFLYGSVSCDVVCFVFRWGACVSHPISIDDSA